MNYRKIPLPIGFVLALVMIAAIGCPTSPERPDGGDGGKSTPAQSTDEDASTTEMPVAEFQQPPALPDAEPLPKVVDTPPVVAETPEPEKKTPSKRRPGKKSEIPFDPIKENGPIFVDWTKPKLALVITGMEDGYLEPCGCAGLDRMRGGMSRRHTFIEGLRKKQWPLVVLDAGGIAHGFGRQAEMKFHTTIEGKRLMGYDVIAFGTNELRLPAGSLVSMAASVDDKPSLFAAANVGLYSMDMGITPTSRIIESGGKKVGVTAVLGKKYQAEINNNEIEMTDPVEALKKVVPELKKKADYLVLLSHATKDETTAYARQFPEFDVVVCSDGPPTPPKAPEHVEGTDTPLITVGHKGMEAIVLGVYDDGPLRYQRVPLDSRFPASQDMKLLMTAYQEELKNIGFTGLGVRPISHPLAETNGQFVGSEKCKSCHEKSFDVWRRSGHAQAYKTLADLDPPRNFDPECISCHVIGWHPTEYFPYKTGFESVEKTPHLINTGCEDCHGPGEKHVEAELGTDEKLQEQYRKAVVITKEESKKRQCMTCHDVDNSPDFKFDDYWPLVEHYEEEEE